MPSPERRLVRFVRLLLPDGEARETGDGTLRTAREGRVASVPVASARALLAAGVLARSGPAWTAGADAASWLRRALLEGGDGFAAQHRQTLSRPDGAAVNLAESPLARLATATAAEPAFLEPHHVEAGERVRRLVERAQLQPRLTMGWSPDRIAGSGGAGPADISDLAADARRALAALMGSLPRECAAVVLDVCALLKGLQTVESERGWPRRSAKLVLRIGLDQAARHFGLDPEAVGGPARGRHAWLGDGARPERFE
jgi:hypothetical protein